MAPGETIHQGAKLTVSGVINQDVEASFLGQNLVYGPFNGGTVGHIQGQGEHSLGGEVG
jgi:hypothetical protein